MGDQPEGKFGYVAFQWNGFAIDENGKANPKVVKKIKEVIAEGYRVYLWGERFITSETHCQSIIDFIKENDIPDASIMDCWILDSECIALYSPICKDVSDLVTT